MESDTPHYLLSTTNTNVREARSIVRFATVLSEKEEKRTVKQANANINTINKRKYKKVMNAEDRIANEEVLKSINHKLNYLRNPRNNPISINKMLTKSYIISTEKLSNHPITIAIRPKVVINDNPLFVSDPQSINFFEYSLGQSYTKPIVFRNVSSVTRMIRISKPSNKDIFTISPIVYPASSSSGLIAPGMNVSTVLTFKPKALISYSDSITVHTEGGSYDVIISANREEPILSLPSIIDIGTCLIGDAKRTTTICTNLGGKSNFKINSFDIDSNNNQCLRIQPFTIYPKEFSLSKNESIEIVIEFIPLDVGEFFQTIYITTDNNKKFNYTITGESISIDISISTINNVHIDNRPNIMKSIYFDNVYVHSEQSQQIEVFNNTKGIDIEYEWMFLLNNIPSESNHMNRHIQQKILNNNIDILDLSTNSNSNQSPNISVIDNDLDDFLVNQNSYTNLDSNILHEYNFKISPYKGILKYNTNQQFLITYNPVSNQPSIIYAYLVLKNIPRVAIVNKQQDILLDNLKTNGHGRYVRFSSWIDELSNNYTIIDNHNSKRLITLSTLINIINRYINSDNITSENLSSQLNDKQNFINYIKDMLDVCNRWSQNALEIDSDDDNEDIDTNDNDTSIFSNVISVHSKSSYLEIECYYKETVDQNVNDNAADKLGNDLENTENDNIVIPINKFKLKLYNHKDSLSNSKSTTQQINKIEEDLDSHIDNQSELSEYNHQEILIQPYDFDYFTSLILIDLSTVLNLLGDDICSYLNDLVNHEAVDYIKSNVLNSGVGLTTSLAGSGEIVEITSKPSHIYLGDELVFGRAYSSVLSYFNSSDTIVSIDFYVDSSTAEYKSNSSIITNDKIEIEFNPSNVLLLPDTSAEVEVTVTSHILGYVDINIPITSKISPFIQIDTLSISFQCIPPTIRFDIPEVDMGLLGIGQEKSIDCNIVNESDVSIRYILTVYIDTTLENNLPKYKNLLGSSDSISRTSSRNSRRPLTRQNSGVSGIHTHRSDETGSIDGSISLSSDNSYYIDNQFAVISFSSPNNEIPSLGTEKLTITCVGGKNPQRLRGRIECKYYDISGNSELSIYTMNLRGEIQAPTAIIYPLSIDLGDIYLGERITFTFYIENKSNLTTKYRIEFPSNFNTSDYSIDISTLKGSLSAKEIVKVEGIFICNVVKLIDEIVSVKVFGINRPFGLLIKANCKSILFDVIIDSYTYQNNNDITNDSTYNNQMSLNSYISNYLSNYQSQNLINLSTYLSKYMLTNELINEINFGDNIPLYTRCSKYLILRNLSGISTQFTITINNNHYNNNDTNVSELISLLHEDNRSGKSNEVDKSYILSNEKNTIFHSKLGKKYINMSINKQIDSHFIYTNKGCCYFIDSFNYSSKNTDCNYSSDGTISGLIQPWDIKIFSIIAFNNMPGVYSDRLDISYKYNQYEEIISLPIDMSVFGCPLAIGKESSGMKVDKVISSESTHTDRYDDRFTLYLGVNYVNSQSILTRDFYVINNGSTSATVTWMLENIPNHPPNGPMSISLELTNGIMKSKFKYWNELIYENISFSVYPNNVIIKPNKKQYYKVVLQCEGVHKLYKAKLVGKISYEDDITTENKSVSKFSSKVNSSLDSYINNENIESNVNTDNQLDDNIDEIDIEEIKAYNPIDNQILTLYLQGEFIHPLLSFNGKQLTVLDKDINFNDVLIALNSDVISLYDNNFTCSELIYLTNPSDMISSINILVIGSFYLSIYNEKKDNDKSNYSKKLRNSINQAANNTKLDVQLLAHESITLRLTYLSTKQLQQTLSAITDISTDEISPTTNINGSLNISYLTGQSLIIPINLTIAIPFITSSSPTMYFGICKVGKNCEGMFLLSNPTIVLAKWQVFNVSNGGISKNTTSIPVKGYENTGNEIDDPDVFIITPQYGKIEGPTISVSATMSAQPYDNMRSSDYVVPSRTTKTSWMDSTLTLQDTLVQKFSNQKNTPVDVRYPEPIKVIFRPKQNVKYRSRFRFSCEYGNSFDIILSGDGTYEEFNHRPLNPIPE